MNNFHINCDFFEYVSNRAMKLTMIICTLFSQYQGERSFSKLELTMRGVTHRRYARYAPTTPMAVNC